MIWALVALWLLGCFAAGFELLARRAERKRDAAIIPWRRTQWTYRYRGKRSD